MNALPPPLPHAVRTQAERLILVCSAAGAALGGFYLLAVSVCGAVWPCAWKSVTSLPCAGCGGTRAALSLASGDWAGALALNPGAVLLFGVLLALNAYAVLTVAGVLQPLRPVFLRGARWRIAVVAVFAANWIYLLVAGRV